MFMALTPRASVVFARKFPPDHGRFDGLSRRAHRRHRPPPRPPSSSAWAPSGGELLNATHPTADLSKRRGTTASDVSTNTVRLGRLENHVALIYIYIYTYITIIMTVSFSVLVFTMAFLHIQRHGT